MTHQNRLDLYNVKFNDNEIVTCRPERYEIKIVGNQNIKIK